MSTSEEAVRSLTELGLTEYEARCFVALARIPSGTARQISEIADVPRSRVYDTIERLDRKGLVNIQQSDPREYQSVSTDLAIERIQDDYNSRINAVENALEDLESPESEQKEGTWEISRSEFVDDRVRTFLEAADESIHLVVASAEAIDRETEMYDHLRSAVERGVDVTVEVATTDEAEAFRDGVSDATVIVTDDLETNDVLYDEYPGKVLLVDGEAVVATAVKESDLPDVVHETAVWTYGRDHGFAVWMRELLDDRLEHALIDSNE
ncbi:TrmB family transcriptional regulator [Natronobacterium texcoconense]|uniref:Sugar-specific transcriptional regulator TrmB n=1 Tax=Natronobacterium texcoconense TaxID=1095778 RepID=A0A1H1HQZ4_NATTX|nr:helix-turn-helix domain-containing protein [Natronobacterium texcoconense]SDR27832.1 Sugar-specific transcriptional regulator TrmB [Natronobacterium texcoconense]